MARLDNGPSPRLAPAGGEGLVPKSTSNGQGLRQAAAGGEQAPPLAQVREPQNRVEELAVGRELERVDAGPAEGGAQLVLASLGRGGEAPSKAAVVRVDEHLLAG